MVYGHDLRSTLVRYLHGEEGALLLLKLQQAGGQVGGAVATLGWVAVPLEEALDESRALGSPLQLHAPPLPLAAAEARSPRTPPLGAWVHFEISVGVTGSHARFLERHPSLAIRKAFRRALYSKWLGEVDSRRRALSGPAHRAQVPRGGAGPGRREASEARLAHLPSLARLALRRARRPRSAAR